MKLLDRKPKVLTPEQAEEIYTKDFFDMILPSTIKFFTDYYIVGDSYRSVWAVREYPPSTEEQAILSQLADRNGGNATHLPQACGKYGTEKNHTECHTQKQAQIKR